jgi:hypothetical protein
MPGYKSDSKFAENAEEVGGAADAAPAADAVPAADAAPAAEGQGGGRRRRRRTRRKGKKSRKSRKGKKSRKARKTRRKGKRKRGLNPYFKLMLAAKKKGAASFKYKGKTYKGRKHNRLGMIYKKAYINLLYSNNI